MFTKRQNEILLLLSSQIENSCKNYAISKMAEEDFILISDVYGKIEMGVTIAIGENCKLATIKRSSVSKFEDFYYTKINEMLNNIIGE